MKYAVIALWLAAMTIARAENWPCWRGPTGMGYTDEKDLPLTWNGKTGENIVWKVRLPDQEDQVAGPA